MPESRVIPEQERDRQAYEADSKKPLYFDCGQCGECCSSWNIPIEGHKAKHLLQQNWVQERLRLFDRKLEALSDGLFRIPLTAENTCVFLADDKRCLVEAHEGLAYKPHECRRFPFATVRLPGNNAISHETSAACKHISEKLLLAFKPIQPKPTDLSVQLEENERLILSQYPKTVSIKGWQKVDWEQSEVWRMNLRDIFSDTSLSPTQALGKAYQSLKPLAENEITPHPTLPCKGRGDTNSLLNFLSHKSSFHKKKDYGFFSNNNSDSKSPLPLRGRVGWGVKPNWILSPFKEWLLILGFLRKPYRSFSTFQLLNQKHYDDRRIFGVPVSLATRKQVHWDMQEDTRIKAFLYNLLCRKVPLIHGQSLLSLWAMAVCAYALVRWYAITLASLRVSKNNPNEWVSICSDDVSSAIRLTERYYTGHQPRFMRWFCQRWKGELLAWLIRL